MDGRLLRQILGGLDRRDHPLDGQKGGEVGRVRRDDDEREEPPHPADDARRDGLRVDVGALLHQGADDEPEAVRQREGVLEDDRSVRVARPRVGPFVRTESG